MNLNKHANNYKNNQVTERKVLTMSSFKKADILIPQNIDFEKWSVVACDQYTSQPEYWQSVYDIVGDAYSTLNIIFPEVYLSEGNG